MASLEREEDVLADAPGRYATVLFSRAAERYLRAGTSPGDASAKPAIAHIMAGLDRDSILREAPEEILKRLREGGHPR